LVSIFLTVTNCTHPTINYVKGTSAKIRRMPLDKIISSDDSKIYKRPLVKKDFALVSKWRSAAWWQFACG